MVRIFFGNNGFGNDGFANNGGDLCVTTGAGASAANIS
jgi:hypothetical protein